MPNMLHASSCCSVWIGELNVRTSARTKHFVRAKEPEDKISLVDGKICGAATKIMLPTNLDRECGRLES